MLLESIKLSYHGPFVPFYSFRVFLCVSLMKKANLQVFSWMYSILISYWLLYWKVADCRGAGPDEKWRFQLIFAAPPRTTNPSESMPSLHHHHRGPLIWQHQPRHKHTSSFHLSNFIEQFFPFTTKSRIFKKLPLKLANILWKFLQTF